MIVLAIYQTLRAILFPFIWLFANLHPKHKIRYQLEVQLNQKNKFNADIAFEISSEGELEQVLYLIESFIEEGKKIELIFSSDSVVQKCLELQKKYQDSLKVYAFPFLSYFPWGVKKSLRELITAPKLIMCRYDFFPELLEVCLNRNFHIVAANGVSLKGNTGIKKYWYHQFYKRVNKVVASTNKDLEIIRELYPNVESTAYDFRPIQIITRQSQREQKFKQKFPEIQSVRKLIKQSQISLIMGSLWFEDLDAVDSSIWDAVKEKKLYIAVLPHDLSEKNIHLISSELPITSHLQIITTRGILCEMYQEFDACYIGGGYSGSPGVHSVLEPYMSGNIVICGTNNSRSSELRAIRSNGGEVTEVDKKNPLSWSILQKLVHQGSIGHDNTVYQKEFYKTKDFIR